MKRDFVRLTLLAAGITAAAVAQTAAGHWQGKILIPEHEVAITVDLAPTAKGAWTGSMSVLGSSSTDVPLQNLSVEGTAVRFTAGLPDRASFEGRLSGDAATIAGKARSAAGEAEFQVTRSGEAQVKLPPPSSPLPKTFEGTWQGVLESNGRKRNVAVKFAPAADGTATALLIANDGKLEIPASTVTIAGNDLRIEVRSVSGNYHGTLGDSGEITGEWSEGANHSALTFKRVP